MRKNILTFAAGLLPAFFLEGMAWLSGLSLDWDTFLIRLGFSLGLLLLTRFTASSIVEKNSCVWPWWGVGLICVGLAAIFPLILWQSTFAAWIVLVAFFVSVSGLEQIGEALQSRVWGRITARCLTSLLMGAFAVLAAQVESGFSEEEFYALLQVLNLSFFLGLWLTALRFIAQNDREITPKCGLSFNFHWVLLIFGIMAIVGSVGAFSAYQQSFYPQEAPTYAGISASQPFICGEGEPAPQVYDGIELFQRLLARVESNPTKGAPEYGMLALGTKEEEWAQRFRETVLTEADEGRFTEPANSIKWSQYEAALRAYYLPKVDEVFPGLFSDADRALLQNWIFAINERTLTVEWVDWMYALAFHKWPEGPYENQENGAGLLALLEYAELADPVLSQANKDYLARNPRGWAMRFRNTDDAFIYQPEWINNAYFQSLYLGERSDLNMALSFEWLLLQALPDGAPLSYNHPDSSSLSGIFYLGARLLEDPRYVWLAGRALDDLEAGDGYLFAQPGVEEPISLKGYSPSVGSCLLYGDSGLPNQIGPLAPDKIVLRDSWAEDSTSLLLNLRFTGWHRYKASNTVTLFYEGIPFITDVLKGEQFSWLPAGRSLFRDKRIPRENLNGLVIQRTGLGAVLYLLTGMGGPWAQDPPYYAEVLAFEPGQEVDKVHTRLDEWCGWQHDRWVYFYHDDGPTIIIDKAQGPARSKAAFVWHLSGEIAYNDLRIKSLHSGKSIEMRLLPIGRGSVSVVRDYEDTSVVYTGHGGDLQLVTVFLPGAWADAEVVLAGHSLEIRTIQRAFTVELQSD